MVMYNFAKKGSHAYEFYNLKGNVIVILLLKEQNNQIICHHTVAIKMTVRVYKCQFFIRDI